MAVFLLLVLVSAGVFLDTSEARVDLYKLPDSYRKGVELALEHVNSHQTFKNVFLFFTNVYMSDIDGGFGVSYIYHHFYLKATKCPKGTADPTPTKCAFRNDRPLIDCGICYKTFGGEIQSEPKPYVQCVHKPQFTPELAVERIEHCIKVISNGSPSLLAAKKPED